MPVTIGRRELIAALGGAVATWPLAARAQQHPARVPRVGIVDDAPMWHSFRQALREFGYIEGESVNYEYRYSEGVPDRLAAVVGELVRRPVDLIAAYGTPPTEAAKAATTTIPIVMIGVGDPVRSGLVASLARPGGNITGNTVLSTRAIRSRGAHGIWSLPCRCLWPPRGLYRPDSKRCASRRVADLLGV
jgi:putative tryptophan/tyrosine transport system substrate-binding protein